MCLGSVWPSSSSSPSLTDPELRLRQGQRSFLHLRQQGLVVISDAWTKDCCRRVSKPFDSVCTQFRE